MKTAFLLLVVTFNLWLATAKLYPQQKSLDQDARTELLQLIKETGGTKVGLEELGTRQLDIKPPGNEEPLTENQGLEILKEDLEATNEGEPEEDEEKINERTGISEKPEVFGDLVLTPAQMKLLNGGGGTAQALFYLTRRWPGGVIPYNCHPSLNSQARAAILAAIKEFQQKSCIRFVPRNARNYRSYKNYVQFIPGNGCYSSFGMTGGRQFISIGRGCEHKGIVQHEILHALGRVHEQSRLDRDSYVYIFLNHVTERFRHNFRKFISYTYGLPYDYQSIMHYGAHAFSSDGRATIIPRRNAHIGQRRGLTTTDWKHVQFAYCGGLEVQSLGRDEVPFNDYYQVPADIEIKL